MRSGRLVLALLVVVLTAAAACTNSGRKGGEASSSSPITWTGSGPSPRSSLVAAGGRVLYIGGEGADAELVALDARGGNVAWTQPVATIADRPTVLVDGDEVIVVAPSGVAIEALAGDTGQQRWRTPLDAPVRSNPVRCGDDICAVIGATDADLGVVQVAPSDGTLRDTGHVVGSVVVAMDGDQVLSVIGTELVLARRHATQEVWRVPLRSLFGGTAIGPAARWEAWPGPDGAWLVWQGPGTGEPGVMTSVADGVAQWDVFGSEPCPFSDDPAARSGHPEFPVLVCFGTPVRSIVGIDPVSGAGRWELDDVTVDGSDATTVVRTGEQSWLLHSGADDVEVDIVEGPRKPGDGVIGGWCGEPAPFPCTVTGGIIPDPDPVPPYGGVTVDGVGVWVLDGQVRAFRPA